MKRILLSVVVLVISLQLFARQITIESKNKIETYRVKWWNLPISFGLSRNWARAMYGVIDIDNGEVALRHALMEGRPLGDYRLHYWPKRKSLMLASHANFPTPELGAWSLLEEPAELVEVLAVSDIIVFSQNSEAEELCHKLETLVPGQVEFRPGFPDKQPSIKQIYIVVGDNPNLEDLKISDRTNKGIIQMKDSIVRINGADMERLQNAERLFLRFAEMAKDESMYKY